LRGKNRLKAIFGIILSEAQQAAGAVNWFWDRPVRTIKRGGCMAEHIMHKKETKKAPQKTLKKKREEKKAKKKPQGDN
jgi:hypothetical protein